MDFALTLADPQRARMPATGAAVRAVILAISILSIPLAAGQALGLTVDETSSWIMALYGVPGVLTIALSVIFRQPLLVTGNLFVLIFISRLGGELGFPALVGAAMVAGVAVLAIGLLGLTRRLAAWVPTPVMFGMLAGAVLPFLFRTFTAIGDDPLLIGGTFLAYVLSLWLLGERIPAILPALVVGLVLAGVTGQFGQLSAPITLSVPHLVAPEFSLQSVLTATPVMVVLITLQANLPSLLFLESQGYETSEPAINGVSGVGTALGSLLGPTGISLSLPAAALVGGDEAGSHAQRYRAAVLAGAAAVVIGVLAGAAAVMIGLLAGAAAELPAIIPPALLVALAGLALVNVLGGALRQMTRGPLMLGPLFAFTIALSDMSLLGFGAFFWALVIGTSVSFLLEREGWRALRAPLDPLPDRSSQDV